MTFIVGCSGPKLFEAEYELKDEQWGIADVPSFEVQIEDTIQPYDFYFLLRNSTHYPYSNFYFIMESEFPDKAVRRDTVECALTDIQGKWLGSGIGDIIDNKILFKKNVVFPIQGKYRFSFVHAMRMEQVPHLTDIGFIIEPSKI